MARSIHVGSLSLLCATLSAASLVGTAAGAAPRFTPLGDFGPTPDANGSYAFGISADGRVVVGASYHATHEGGSTLLPFRWTRSSGMTNLGVPEDALPAAIAQRVSDNGTRAVGNNGFTIGTYYEARNGATWKKAAGPGVKSSVYNEIYYASDLSADGGVVVGATRVPGPWPVIDQAFRMTDRDGIVPLGFLPGGSYSAASAVSGDGSVVVGFGDSDAGFLTPFVWTQNTGMTRINDLPIDQPGQAGAVSRDGSVIAGVVGFSLFRWSAIDGYEDLGGLGGDVAINGSLMDVSADGQTIVTTVESLDGTTPPTAAIWTRSGGLRPLSQLLTDDLGVDLTGWTLVSANGVSDDGRFVTGTGINPDGLLEGYVARVPGPGVTVLVAIGLSAMRRRRRGAIKLAGL